MGDERMVFLVSKIFSQKKKVMTSVEIANSVEEKIGKTEILKRFKSPACFNSSVRNTLTMYNSFKFSEKNEKGHALWFYDKDKKLVRKKYEKKSRSQAYSDLPEPPRFPEELFLPDPTEEIIPFEDHRGFFLWYTKDNIPFGN